jgi:phospholipase/lecithinase/hemolysin
MPALPGATFEVTGSWWFPNPALLLMVHNRLGGGVKRRPVRPPLHARSGLYFRSGMKQTYTMRPSSVTRLVQFAVGILLFSPVVCWAQPAFSSLYIFGDGVSATTNNPTASRYYYGGLRESNGRVWVEVLAQELGLTNNFWYSNNISHSTYYTNLTASSTNWSFSSNNWSYYGDDSSNLVKNVNNFVAPANASSALFIVWVNDADFVNDMATIYNNGHGTNITLWTNAVNQSLTNHWKAITNLYYAKSARTLIMPNAVDITETPAYNYYPTSDLSFIRQRVIGFNTAFTALLYQARTSLPGITIYEPDFFTLLDNVLANAAAYGLTSALLNGHPIDALDDPALTNLALNGPGAIYIFWDQTDPTAKLHAVMADIAKQLVLPAQITNFTVLNGSNQLDVVNIPIGLNGLVEGTTNLVPVNWTTNASFSSISNTQAVFVPASGSPQLFYRLQFPFAWSWP